MSQNRSGQHLKLKIIRSNLHFYYSKNSVTNNLIRYNLFECRTDNSLNFFFNFSKAGTKFWAEPFSTNKEKLFHPSANQSRWK